MPPENARIFCKKVHLFSGFFVEIHTFLLFCSEKVQNFLHITNGKWWILNVWPNFCPKNQGVFDGGCDLGYRIGVDPEYDILL